MGRPADFANILNAVMWLQVALATVFVALRFYTRYFVIRNLGWDDAATVVVIATFIGYVGCISVGTQYGVGKKTAQILEMQLDISKAVYWEAVGQGICIMGIAASKASVALFLLRIVLKPWHIAILWFTIISTTILCIITTTLLYVQCKPYNFLWDRTIEGGYCWLNFTQVGLTMGAWSAAMDFVLALLPWHVVLNLNMKRKEKITIASGLSLGIFAGACSIVRTIELQSLSSEANYVYDTASMLLWSSSEVFLTIACATIPVLRPLYVRMVYGSRGDSSGGQSYPLNDYSKSKSKNSNGGKGGDNQSSNRIYMGPHNLLETTVRMGSDNASEETILREIQEGDDGTKKSRDIKVTTTVTSQDDRV